jgi:hypothetical protein
MRALAPLLSAAVLLTACFVATANGDPEPSKKQTGPIRVRLKAKKTAYVLDRQGMTADKYRQAVKDGKIAPPAIDLVLEITNTTKGDVDVTVVGASPRLALELKGKEGIEKLTGSRAREMRVRIILKPGQTHTLPITRLAGYSSATAEHQLFWTEPGEYKLTASFETNVREATGGKRGKTFLSRETAYKAPPVTLSVTLEK